MADVQINLSDELQEFVLGQASAGKYADAGAYIEALVAKAKAGQERLDALLIEGLDSGDAIPFNAAEWESIRSEVHEQLGSNE